MSGKTTIKLRLDPDAPPPLTDEQIAMLDALENKPDAEIDYSDVPQHDFARGAVKKVAVAPANG